MGSIAILALVASTARAETFTVTKTADTNDGICNADCSLREAITAANANPGADVVSVPAGTYVLGLLNTLAEEQGNATGDLDVSGDVDIEGAGEATTVVDGNAIDRVFDTLSGVVRISDLSIQNGDTNSDGGGIRNNTVLTLTRTTLEDNTAGTAGPPAFGGGVFNFTSGDLTVQDSTFSNNFAASNGGGIYTIEGPVAVSGSTFIGNRADVQGGGLMNQGTMTIVDSLVDANSADDGGGVMSRGVDVALSIQNTTLSNNSADGVDLNGGGGLFNSLGEATVAGSHFSDNTAFGEGGGAILNSGRLTVTDSTFSGNVAVDHGTPIPGSSPGFGGAILLVNEADTIVSHSHFVDNTAGRQGGAFYVDILSSLALSDSTLNSNRALDKAGGAILNQGQLTVTRCTMGTNTAVTSGGGVSNQIGSASLMDSTVSNNTSSNAGGLGNFSGGTLLVTGTTVSGNVANDGDGTAFGGGIQNDVGTLTVTNSTISGNTSGIGGGISNNQAAGTVNLTNVTIADNTALNLGPQGAAGSAITNFGTLNSANTIFDGNCGNQGTFHSNGGNLETPGSTCPFGAGDQSGVADALLGPLAANGGPTLTHKPLAGSPAIDRADNGVCPADDQRGRSRPFDGDGDEQAVCDVGAVEVPEPARLLGGAAGLLAAAGLVRRRR